MVIQRHRYVVVLFACVAASPDHFTRLVAGMASGRELQSDSLRGGRLPNCPAGYKDRTGGNAFWWTCARGCPGLEPWATAHCECACVDQHEFASIASRAVDSTIAPPSAVLPAQVQTMSSTPAALVTGSQIASQPIVTSTSNFLAPYLTSKMSTQTSVPHHLLSYVAQAGTPAQAISNAGVQVLVTTPPPQQANFEYRRPGGDEGFTVICLFIAASLCCVIGCTAVGLCIRKYHTIALQKRANSRWDAQETTQVRAGRSKLSRVHPLKETQTKSVKAIQATQTHSSQPNVCKFAPQPLAQRPAAADGGVLAHAGLLKLVTASAISEASTRTPSGSSSNLSAEAHGEERRERTEKRGRREEQGGRRAERGNERGAASK